MGIADQFKDKAQELADQAKQKANQGKGAGRDRAKDADRDRDDDTSGLRDRGQDAADKARERFDR